MSAHVSASSAPHTSALASKHESSFSDLRVLRIHFTILECSSLVALWLTLRASGEPVSTQMPSEPPSR